MSKIHQIQLQYVALEDRGLLRIRTHDDVEYRFWLTRRYVRLLWPRLVELMQTDQAVRQQVGEQAKRAVVSFQHESALSESDFETPFVEPETVAAPLGETPVLLSRLNLRAGGNQSPILSLHPQEGQGIELALTAVLVHSLSKLIADVVRVAEWDLDVTIADGAPALPDTARVN